MYQPTEKLKHPSVIEAVCEFRFNAGVSYTMIPGGIRERLRGTFPVHEILPTATLMGGIPDAMLPTGVPHHRFRSEVPNALVQTGPRLLSVNVLRPYPNFEVFRQLILDVLGVYTEIAEPGNPGRVSLRYINHLSAKVARQEIGSYVSIVLSYPKALHHPPSEVATRLVLPYEKLGKLGLAVSFPARTAQGDLGALIDLEFTAEEGEFDLKLFPTWLDEAHNVIYRAFTETVVEQIMSEMRGDKP